MSEREVLQRLSSWWLLNLMVLWSSTRLYKDILSSPSPTPSWLQPICHFLMLILIIFSITVTPYHPWTLAGWECTPLPLMASKTNCMEYVTNFISTLLSITRQVLSKHKDIFNYKIKMYRFTCVLCIHLFL